MTDDIALAILTELKAMNALLRRGDFCRRRQNYDELVTALSDFFGPGPFTTAGVLSVDDPALADALGALLVDGPGRSVSLGRLLSRLADAGHLERLPDRGGVAMFRVVA